ncbi:MAG: hypothetical protein M3N54_12335 [Acidobacteriota bacterium]|nr:hypothetical protein [Acidobacteriota bacterium]
MTRTLRILFLGRPAREKFLILALLVLAAGLWLSAFSSRAAGFFSEERRTTQELKDQKQWLSHRAQIERQAKTEAARLDPTRTLDAARLQAALFSIANEHHLVFSSSDSQDRPGGQFVIHSLQITFTSAEYGTLWDFYSEIERRAPYISVESFSIAANKAQPSQLNATLRVSSVEIVRR